MRFEAFGKETVTRALAAYLMTKELILVNALVKLCEQQDESWQGTISSF